MTAGSEAVFMARAIALAEKGKYTTDPNPRVGCVIVKDQRIIAEGWHEKAGEAHAERVALANTDQAQGATAYVSLEPCSHFGRTAPCCDALIDAGVARVVVAMQDPNPLVSGRGISRLREAGIQVDCGMLEQDAMAINRGFIKRMTQALPYVRSKLGLSLDGRTAMASGESQWITSSQSRTDVQYFRAESSVILTGINTVLADDPALTVRLAMAVKPPIRVVLDSALRLPVSARILKQDGAVWIITCCQNETKARALRDAGAHVFIVDAINERVDLYQALALLAAKEINTVWVEAGSVLNGALVDAELVDEWIIYMAPCVLGDQAKGAFNLPALTRLSDKKQFSLSAFRQVGPDLRLTFRHRC